jgi:HAE1 family hydrophobic/amphiphilic exporter-1
MPGVAGQWFKPFALTIASAVLVSLFVSFSLDPMLSAYWADPQIEAHERETDRARARPLQPLVRPQADRYRTLISWALDHRCDHGRARRGSLVLAIVLRSRSAASVRPGQRQHRAERGVEAPPGSSLEYTTLKALEVVRVVRTHPEVEYTYTTVGSSSGTGQSDMRAFYVGCRPSASARSSQAEFGAQLRTEMRQVGGATAYTFDAGFGGNEKQMQLQVQGPDEATLNRLAQEIADSVAAPPARWTWVSPRAARSPSSTCTWTAAWRARSG